MADSVTTPNHPNAATDLVKEIIGVPSVYAKDGAIRASSRDIAASFGKQHKHVLRDIDHLLKQAPDLNGSNFGLVDYVDDKGEVRRAYEMDRKGFALLAMRFTGAKALAWQLAYIDAFDRMEAALHAGDGAIHAVDPGAMKAIGGMMKGIVGKAINDALPALVETAVRDRLASERFKVVEGVSALEVLELAGFQAGQRPRGMSQFVSGQLRQWHLGQKMPMSRSRHGSGRVYVYDEMLSRRWLDCGGRRALTDWRNSRLGVGQVPLKLVQRG